MKRQACLVVLLSSLAACGGGDPDIDIDPMPIQCNPETQSGCAEGEKCAHVLVQLEPTVITRTACVADGTVEAGGACDEGETGETTGFDNCVAGYHCLDGTCTEVCSRTGVNDTCAGPSADFNCVQFEGLFDEVDGFYGLCAEACNPVTQDCADLDQGCFLNMLTQEASCADVPTPALSKIQDSVCYGPESGRCFLNGCPKGYGAILANDNTTATTAVCAGFCTPVEVCDPTSTGSHTTACVANAATAANLGGDPAGINCTSSFDDPRPDNGTGPNGPYHCRFIQSFYEDADLVAIGTGFCVSRDEWSPVCDTCNITNATTFKNTCAPGPGTIPPDPQTMWAFGCVNFTTLLAIPPAPAPATLTIGDVLAEYPEHSRAVGIDPYMLPGYAYGMSRTE